MPDDQFDPQRLVALARARDQRRAYAKSLGDRYQDIRNERADVTRRLAHARQNAQHSHGFKHEGDQKISALEAQERDLTARLAEVQAEQDCVISEAGEAGQLYRNCLVFAVHKNLTVPASLVSDAAALDRTHMPLASVGGAS